MCNCLQIFLSRFLPVDSPCTLERVHSRSLNRQLEGSVLSAALSASRGRMVRLILPDQKQDVEMFQTGVGRDSLTLISSCSCGHENRSGDCRPCPASRPAAFDLPK